MSETDIDDEGEELEINEAEGEELEAGGGDDEALNAATEALARSRGWKPESEWKGELPKHFENDPAKFNENHERHNPRLIAEVQELRRQSEENAEITRRNFEMLRKSKDDEIARLKADARERMTRAVEEADTAAYRKAEQDFDALNVVPEQPKYQQQPPADAQADADQDPNYISWHASNAWYNTDKVRTNYANTAAVAELHQRGISAKTHGRAFYDEVTKIVDRDMGPPAGRPGKGRADPATAGDGGGGRPKKGSFESIPAADRKAFKDTLVPMGIYENTKESRAEYAKAYWSDRGEA